jgi:periplasmic protein TonB
MYATVQQSGGTRITGIIAAVLMTLGAGYVFSSGFAQHIVPILQTKTELVMIAPKEEPLPLPVKKEEPKEVKVAVPELVAPPIEYVPEEPVITAPPAPEVPVAPTPIAGPVNPAGSDRVPPKLRPGEKPAYPPASIRAQEQGVTQLEVCVTDKGRVQSVNVRASSGSPRLDEAAAKWIRNERFTPGSVGGVPQSMCGHTVSYQWNLQDART